MPPSPMQPQHKPTATAISDGGAWIGLHHCSATGVRRLIIQAASHDASAPSHTPAAPKEKRSSKAIRATPPATGIASLHWLPQPLQGRHGPHMAQALQPCMPPRAWASVAPPSLEALSQLAPAVGSISTPGLNPATETTHLQCPRKEMALQSIATMAKEGVHELQAPMVG